MKYKIYDKKINYYKNIAQYNEIIMITYYRCILPDLSNETAGFIVTDYSEILQKFLFTTRLKYDKITEIIGWTANKMRSNLRRA